MPLRNARRALQRSIQFLRLPDGLCRLDSRLFRPCRLCCSVCYTPSSENNHHNLVIAFFSFHLTVPVYIDTGFLLGVFFIIYIDAYRNAGKATNSLPIRFDIFDSDTCNGSSQLWDRLDMTLVR
jgi:hypothetical protein